MHKANYTKQVVQSKLQKTKLHKEQYAQLLIWNLLTSFIHIICQLIVLGAVHLWRQPLWGEGGRQPNDQKNADVINERPLTVKICKINLKSIMKKKIQ